MPHAPSPAAPVESLTVGPWQVALYAGPTGGPLFAHGPAGRPLAPAPGDLLDAGEALVCVTEDAPYGDHTHALVCWVLARSATAP